MQHLHQARSMLQIAFFNFQSTPESGDTDGLWEQIYGMIYRANTILANIDRADWTDNEEMKNALMPKHIFSAELVISISHLVRTGADCNKTCGNRGRL